MINFQHYGYFFPKHKGAKIFDINNEVYVA